MSDRCAGCVDKGFDATNITSTGQQVARPFDVDFAIQELPPVPTGEAV